MQLKLADFGFAKHLDPEGENVKECRGSPLYMAPEIFTRGGVYTEKCDLWSVGVILYGKICVGSRDNNESGRFVVFGNVSVVLEVNSSKRIMCLYYYLTRRMKFT